MAQAKEVVKAKSVIGKAPISTEARVDTGERSKEDYAIPFLRALQSNSPQVNQRDDAYVKGAKPGMLFNTLDEVIYDGDKGVNVIPIEYKRSFIEWRPREEGGGFVQEHSVREGEQLEKTGTREGAKTILPNGNELHDTRSWFCYQIDLDTGKYDPVMISMSSTNIRASKNWLTTVERCHKDLPDGTRVPAKFWEVVYHVTTEYKENDKGNWYGLKVKPVEEGWIQDPALLTSAESFSKSLINNEVKVEYQKDDAIE